jgi:hypothetical protein
MRFCAYFLCTCDNESGNPSNAPLQPFRISSFQDFPASLDEQGRPPADGRAEDLAEVDDEGSRVPSAQKLTRSGSKAPPGCVHPMCLMPYEIEPKKD